MDNFIVNKILKTVVRSYTAPRDYPALASVNKQFYGLSQGYKLPLRAGDYVYYSAYYGDAEMLGYLRDKGVQWYDAELCAKIRLKDPNIKSLIDKISPDDVKAWNTALLFAIRANDKELVDLFIDKGARNFSRSMDTARKLKNSEIFMQLRKRFSQIQNVRPIRHLYTQRDHIKSLVGVMYPEMNDQDKNELADRCMLEIVGQRNAPRFRELIMRLKN